MSCLMPGHRFTNVLVNGDKTSADFICFKTTLDDPADCFWRKCLSVAYTDVAIVEVHLAA